VKHKITELVQSTKAHDIHLVLLEESWLDASIENLVLPNFAVISRRDRSEGPNRGGVVGFVRRDVNNISFLYNATIAERSWHVIQRDTSSIAIGNWYFSPQASLDDIDSLATELQDMQNQFDHVIVTGDLNTHHTSWLRFSNGNTPRGAKLKHVCDVHGLRQIVKQPTRGPYLLDLVLTDFKAACVEMMLKLLTIVVSSFMSPNVLKKDRWAPGISGIILMLIGLP